jgi:hypothetical protein
VLNIAGVVVLGLVFWRLGSFGKWRHPREAGETDETDRATTEPPAPAPVVASPPPAVVDIIDKEPP